jgi:hypothetical protein
MTRKTRFLAGALAMLGACGLIAEAGGDVQAAAPTRIYVTFVSHNEESSSNPPCAPVMTSQARYLSNRAAVVSLAHQIAERGATWDFQSEWEYLLRVSQWDDATARATTSGMNIVEYLSRMAPEQVVVDAHSHERRGYNYADVAYLLETLGVSSTGVVGGFIYTPASRETWTRLQTGLRGQRYPSAFWQPEILWGGGSANHMADSNASGIWRPKSAAEFHTDDPTQRLINIGHYVGGPLESYGIEDLLDRLRAGTLEPGHMYTATMMIPQCELDSDPAAIPRVLDIIDNFADAVGDGSMVWATLPEMARIWHDEYGSTPTIFRP